MRERQHEREARGGSRNSAASTATTATTAVRMRVDSMRRADDQASCVACTCSLVRPKRRSRVRYDAIAASSAAASKSGHSMSVK